MTRGNRLLCDVDLDLAWRTPSLLDESLLGLNGTGCPTLSSPSAFARGNGNTYPFTDESRNPARRHARRHVGATFARHAKSIFHPLLGRLLRPVVHSLSELLNPVLRCLEGL